LTSSCIFQCIDNFQSGCKERYFYRKNQIIFRNIFSFSKIIFLRLIVLDYNDFLFLISAFKNGIFCKDVIFSVNFLRFEFISSKMNLLNRLSLVRQFILLSGIILFFAVLSAGIFFFSVDRLFKLHFLSESFAKYRESIAEIQQEYRMFILSTHQSEFYETGDDNQTAALFFKCEMSYKIYDEIRNELDNPNEDLLLNLKESNNLIQKFEKNFRILSAGLSKAGTEKIGLTADLYFSGNQVETKIKQTGIFDDIRQFEEVRKLENEYLQGHLNTTAENFLKKSKLILVKYSNFKDSTQQLSVIKMRISDALAQYINNFELLANIYSQAGLGNKNGIDGTIQNIFEESEHNTGNVSAMLFDDIRQKYKLYSALLLIFGFFIIFFTAILLYWYSSIINKKVRALKKMSLNMASGSLLQLNGVDSADEFGQISQNINKHLASLLNKNQFIRAISELRIDADPEILSNEDMLGISLKYMKENILEKDKKEHSAKQEKEIQDRHVRGLAEFGGILRKNTDKPELLSYELVSNLVKFLDAEVCGIYLLSAESHLVPIATYAYNERKIYEKVILPGEGLVGTCALEKITFYFEDLPEDYIQIISGFGKVKPKTLLLTPLVLNEEVYGVVELASLKGFAKSDIHFLETLGEDIAATLAFMRTRELSAGQMRNSAAGFLKSSYVKNKTKEAE